MTNRYSDDYLRAMGDADVMADELHLRMDEEYQAVNRLQRYHKFLDRKKIKAKPSGFTVSVMDLNPHLLDWQRVVVRWSLGKGKACLFEGCGLGKTFQQLEWGHHVNMHTFGDVLLLAPLAVSEQTHHIEAPKFGIHTTLCRSQKDVRAGINITNYEMLEHFDTSMFAGVILDESSILKSYDGSTRKAITEAFSKTPYRLACSATPAPNDHMELGTHAEFMGVMTRQEMLSMFFVHDGGDTSKWRLKGHAASAFWKWVCSWAVMIQKPSDIGYSDEGYILPPLRKHVITVDLKKNIEGFLFTPDVLNLQERREVRQSSLEERVAKAAELINGDTSGDQWLVWCDLNAESQALTVAIKNAVEVTGSDSREHKTKCIVDFVSGSIERLVSKGSIFGFGTNLQNCRKMALVGLSDSFELVYQIIRRCWRFGQMREVEVYFIVSDGDGPVIKNIERKERDFECMIAGMVEHMKDEMKAELVGTENRKEEYRHEVRKGNGWEMHLGDSVETLMTQVADNSMDFSCFSPPFSSLYTYSASDRDMGNAKDYEEFSEHFGFLTGELYRVMKPGRLVAIHCMNLPLTKERDGVIGIRDFRGDIIRAMQKVGFIFHSEVTIWKDPVTAMQRTKAIGLLYKQLRKDSCISRQGIPDYLVVFRKDGENQERDTKTHESFPVDRWQRYASPVWMDIDQSDTLTREGAREEADERHICCLQLRVIERAIELWTNPGDIVLSPYGGIGSEGYQAIRMDRRYWGGELKESYWKQACANLAAAETAGKAQGQLFA